MVVGIHAKTATQRDLDRGILLPNNIFAEVNWLDACFHMNVEKLNPKRLEKWLCPTKTIGKIIAQDSSVLCIATNISNANGIDMIAIPKRWIKEIRIFEGG